jgi:hypothetical protein
MIEDKILSGLNIFLYFLELYSIYKIWSKFQFKWNLEMTKLPLGPPISGAQWVGLDPFGSDRPTRSLATPPPSSRLTLASAPATPWSPPPSPINLGRLRPSPANRWVASDSPLDGGHDGPRRSDGHTGDAVVSPPGVPLSTWCCAGVPWWSPWLGLARPGAAVCPGVRRRGRHGSVDHLLPGMCSSPLSIACTTSLPSSGYPGVHGLVLLLRLMCWLLLLLALACHVLLLLLCVLLLCALTCHVIASVTMLVLLLLRSSLYCCSAYAIYPML